FFRRGEAARDIRLQAAQGSMAPRAHEQIALLMVLADDQDPEIAAAAHATIGAIPRASLEAFLARSDASTEMREFFAIRGIQPSAIPAPEAHDPLLDLSEQPQAPGVDEELPDGQVRESTVQKIAAMNVA